VGGGAARGRRCGRSPSELEVGFGKLAQPVRVAVTGTTVSPPLFGTLVLIGRERCSPAWPPLRHSRADTLASPCSGVV
jgi:hypothetical protein